MVSGTLSEFMPTSITSTSMPKSRAIADMPVLPRVIFIACASVTLCGVEATPSATIPLSAANTTMRVFSMRLHTRPVIPASRTEISSSAPRLPGGFASLLCLSFAAAFAAESAGRMREINAFSSVSFISSIHCIYFAYHELFTQKAVFNQPNNGRRGSHVFNRKGCIRRFSDDIFNRFPHRNISAAERIVKIVPAEIVVQVNMHKLRCESVDPMRQRDFGNAAVCMPDIKAKPETRIVNSLGNRRCDFRFGFHNVFKQKITDSSMKYSL